MRRPRPITQRDIFTVYVRLLKHQDIHRQFEPGYINIQLRHVVMAQYNDKAYKEFYSLKAIIEV